MPIEFKGFTGGPVVNNLPANAGHPGDIVLIHGLGKLPWRRKWQPVTPYSYLENPMDRGAWCATVHGIAKNQT